MSDLTRQKELIKKIIENMPASLDEALKAQAERFINIYFQRIALEDLEKHSIEDLAGSALAVMQLAKKRTEGQNKVRVYNPVYDKHGWQSTHTVVEIITQNRPFLVDSISMALNRLGTTIHLTIHPVISAKRDSQGVLTDLESSDTKEAGFKTESIMHFEIDRQTEGSAFKEIETDIKIVLNEVAVAVDDWEKMVKQVKQITADLKKQKNPFDANINREMIEFCRYIIDDHFTFLGYCEDVIKGDQLEFKKGSGLGLLRNGHHDILPTGAVKHLDDEMIIVTKANNRSRIHRPAYMDFIGINRYDENGDLLGQYCILGLFTSSAYNKNVHEIPLLRDKVARVLAKSNLPVGGHDYKSLDNIFETYPRDSLFAITDDDLFNISMGILALQERQRIRFFSRHDKFDRFYSCMVYVPNEIYNRELRIKIQNILMDAYKGTTSQFNTHFSESVLARVHFIIRIKPGTRPKYSDAKIEDLIIEAARSWNDHIRETLTEQFGEEKGTTLLQKYDNAFSVGYQSDFNARSAASDIGIMETLGTKKTIDIHMYRPIAADESSLRMKLYSRGKAISPSDALPVIENMGLKVLAEKPYKVQTGPKSFTWVHDFSMQAHSGMDIAIDEIAEIFQNSFLRVWKGDAENDGFNQLVIKAGLNWREVATLRGYSKYLRQIGIRYSEPYMIECLVDNFSVSRMIVALFKARFDPELKAESRKAQLKSLQNELETGLESVSNLDDDRILRSFINLVNSTIRTNYFQPDAQGEFKTYISFKYDPSKINNLPLPRPVFEIFVYSPRVEAVHLRGGRVARGGLRWSDRREDFRTEILGLVKAQLVKNAVIVPTGSKGGFYVKRPPAGGDRNAILEEGIACYKIFMSGLLDITDNIIKGDIVPPLNVVRHDNDDPYLVVAADKGTATFSDIANGVAREYGFWLDDAFASGGSVGYDHKGMGITARGAWESVKRNFRELGHDTQTQAFTVIGIGDMAGDVFGNGMLLSRKIKLVGAFNHMHIFIDPDPNPEKSFIERERMFKLPRSSWADYNTKLISKGGGIFERSAKSIKLSPEVKAVLDTSVDSLTPNELIHSMLKAPVDLLWNGGIGTYVKSTQETHEDASDRANDNLRVNGNQLRCKVIGEGGNLGVTQLGRIEFCQNGGKCYTDFIDNSAGVDTSDHEVNIKILLNEVVENGDMTVKQRNALLADMTDTVAKLVLTDNYDQTQAISIERTRAVQNIKEHSRFIKMLEKAGILNRELEYLPGEGSLKELATSNHGLTAPEISVLLAYSKIHIYDKLLDSPAPDDGFLRNVIEHYFPQRLVKNYRTEIAEHRLRREIVATYITNKMVNQAGPLFAFQLSETTGASYADISSAFICSREIFTIDDVWEQIESLDNKVDAAVQMQMLSDAAGLLERSTLWLLRNRRMPIDIQQTIDYFTPGINDLRTCIPRCFAKPNKILHKKRKDLLVKKGVNAGLADQVASFVALSSSLDLVEVAKEKNVEMNIASSIYFSIGDILDLHWLRDSIAALRAENHWHLLAKSSLRNQLHRIQRLLTADMLSANKGSAKQCIDAWNTANTKAEQRFKNVLKDLKRSGKLDFPMLSVALGELQILRQSNDSASVAESESTEK